MSCGEVAVFAPNININVFDSFFLRMICNGLNFLIPLIVIGTFTQSMNKSFRLIFSIYSGCCTFHQSYNKCIHKYIQQAYILSILIVQPILNNIVNIIQSLEWWWVGGDEKNSEENRKYCLNNSKISNKVHFEAGNWNFDKCWPLFHTFGFFHATLYNTLYTLQRINRF